MDTAKLTINLNFKKHRFRSSPATGSKTHGEACSVPGCRGGGRRRRSSGTLQREISVSNFERSIRNVINTAFGPMIDLDTRIKALKEGRVQLGQNVACLNKDITVHT